MCYLVCELSCIFFFFTLHQDKAELPESLAQNERHTEARCRTSKDLVHLRATKDILKFKFRPPMSKTRCNHTCDSCWREGDSLMVLKPWQLSFDFCFICPRYLPNRSSVVVCDCCNLMVLVLFSLFQRRGASDRRHLLLSLPLPVLMLKEILNA